MANTVIQLKYSNVTGTPPSLNLAEPAYSNVSNKLWIDDGSGVVAIGGKYYTDLLDASTQLATQNTIVRRDTSGNFAANTITINTINANTSVVQNGYNLYDFANAAFTQANTAIVAGGTIAGGYANSAYLHANAAYVSQNTTGVYANTAFQYANSAGSYANSAFIKANSAFAHSNLTLDYATAGYGHANAAYSHANTKLASAGGTITGNLAITGNLTVAGNTTTINVNTLNVADPIIYLAANNYSSDTVGIGFAGNYYDGTTQRHAGLVRMQTSNTFYLFTGYDEEFDNNTLNVANPTLIQATLKANVSANSVTVRGVDVLDHANASYLHANSAYVSQNTTGVYANTAYLHANAAYVSQNTTGVYANTAYLHANSAYVSQNTTGVYANTAYLHANSAYVSQNTTGVYANSAYTHANAAFNFANTDFTNVSTTAGTYGSASVVPSFRVEANGRVSSITTNSIAIDAGAITTGTLGVVRGGTGNTAFTANHVILGNGTGALTTVGSSTEGHLLTINASGVPTFQHLNGGSF